MHGRSRFRSKPFLVAGHCGSAPVARCLRVRLTEFRALYSRKTCGIYGGVPAAASKGGPGYWAPVIANGAGPRVRQADRPRGCYPCRSQKGQMVPFIRATLSEELQGAFAPSFAFPIAGVIRKACSRNRPTVIQLVSEAAAEKHANTLEHGK